MALDNVLHKLLFPAGLLCVSLHRTRATLSNRHLSSGEIGRVLAEDEVDVCVITIVELPSYDVLAAEILAITFLATGDL